MYFVPAAHVALAYMSNMQATISTALPTIIHDLGGGSSFIWVGSVYTLCATAVIPFTGSMAEVSDMHSRGI